MLLPATLALPDSTIKKRPYLLSDFSKKGFGGVLLQADSDHPESMAAMYREMAGGNANFCFHDQPSNFDLLDLHPVPLEVENPVSTPI